MEERKEGMGSFVIVDLQGHGMNGYQISYCVYETNSKLCFML